MKNLCDLCVIETENITYEVLYDLLLGWGSRQDREEKPQRETQRWNDYRTPLDETPLRPLREKSLRPLREKSLRSLREIETANVTYEYSPTISWDGVLDKTVKKNRIGKRKDEMCLSPLSLRSLREIIPFSTCSVHN